jgi:dCTP deaminase
MSIKPDAWIEKMALECDMIKPFSPNRAVKDKISFGLSSYGYDISLADEFIFLKKNIPLVDPKAIKETDFINQKSEYFILPANSFVLARTKEYFKIPRGVITVCVGKSTYARCGVIVNVTPFEPEWEGYATLAISNAGLLPVKLYANEGIAQVLFFEADELCRVSYKDKKGIYQAQSSITVSKTRK